MTDHYIMAIDVAKNDKDYTAIMLIKRRANGEFQLLLNAEVIEPLPYRDLWEKKVQELKEHWARINTIREYVIEEVRDI